MIFRSFDERISELARRIGMDPGDLDSGHVRWGIYSRAMEDSSEWPELLELVKGEPDPPIASSVVVQMLEVLPDDLRMEWVSALPPGRDREYAATRTRELAILERVSTENRSSSEERFNMREWSTWLQLRAANKASDISVLEDLSSMGKTKRVRASAARRLRALRGSS